MYTNFLKYQIYWKIFHEQTGIAIEYKYVINLTVRIILFDDRKCSIASKLWLKMMIILSEIK